jgi:hypothetical protein
MLKIITTLLLIFTTTAFAGMDAIKASNNQIGVQFVSTNIDYIESYPDGTTANTEKGGIQGFGLSLTVMKDLLLGNDYLKASFNHSKGDVDYLGSLGGGCYAVCIAYEGYSPIYGSYGQKNHAKVMDFTLRYGKGLELNNSLMLTPYAELGHHEWKRDLGDTCVVGITPDCASSEKYKHYYSGLGALIQQSPNQNLVLTLDGFIGHTFSSKISGSGTTYLNTIPGVFTSFSPQDLGDKAMYRLGVSADYAFTTQIHANIGVDYLAFKYGRSAIFNEYSYEPDSKTNYTNVKVGVGYAF